MPLDRDHVTQASRVMLPTYVCMFLLLGSLLITQGTSRTSGNAYDVAKRVMPIHLWGVLFVVVALIEIVALVAHRRALCIVGLTIGVGVVAFWAVILGAAAVDSPTVPFTGCIWVGGWVAVHISTALSLARRERS